MQDLDDGALRLYLGALEETMKRLIEAEKADTYIQEVKTKLKEYIDEHYRNQLSECRLKLKIARRHAKVRGIEFTLGEFE